MAAYDSHLRKVHANEVIYGGRKPSAKPFTTDRDILDAQHRFMQEDMGPSTDPMVKKFYENLIKDCVLVDLSRYKEKKVLVL